MRSTDAQPIPELLLPTGEVTPGVRPRHMLRLRNARVACALNLAGKRVLNVGCMSGLHSFYMAPSADEVIGIDQSATSIAIAESTKKALGVSNVSFRCGDVRDPTVFEGLPQFDLVIAWGFLHRISDIFALLHTLAPITDALSLEWRTPVLPFMSNLSLAYHPTVGEVLNPKNVGPNQRSDDRLETEKWSELDKLRVQTGFWEPTPGAVSAICRRFGYKHARLIGYGENFNSGGSTIVRHWAKHLAKLLTAKKLLHQIPLARVHMIFEKSAGSIEMRDQSESDVELPEWDIALQKALRKEAGY